MRILTTTILLSLLAALLLCRGALAQNLAALVPPGPVQTQTVYVVVYCIQPGFEVPYSPYSTQLVAIATNNLLSVGWSGRTNAPTNVLLWGTNSGNYQWSTNVGTNLSALFNVLPVPPAAPVSNFVWYVLETASKLTGPFTSQPGHLTRTNTGISNEFARLKSFVTNAP